jgi:hypothetical protein
MAFSTREAVLKHLQGTDSPVAVNEHEVTDILGGVLHYLQNNPSMSAKQALATIINN